MGLEDVVKKLNKSVLMNEKIPEDVRMLQMKKLNPDKKIIFSKERERVIKKLLERGYISNEVLREDLKKINFDLSWCILNNADLSNLNLSNVNFSVADLTGSRFLGCDLTGADFSISKITGADFSNANMRSANLSMGDCSNAHFNNTILSMGDCVACVAVGTDFTGADLSNADLSNSNLMGAKFEGANTTGINVNNCILEGTVFEGSLGSSDESKKMYDSMKDVYEQTDKIRDILDQESVYSSKSHYSSGTKYKHKKPYR